MINYFENDYSIPVILGSNVAELNAANIIRKQSKKEIHVFAQKLSLINKARYSFHKLPQGNSLLPIALKDFANSIHEYYTPLLIYGNGFSDFIEENKTELESIYITIPATEIEKYFTNTLKE